MWRRDSSYVKMVESAWGAHDTPACLNQFAANIGHVSKVMQEWERSSFGSVPRASKNAQRAGECATSVVAFWAVEAGKATDGENV